ncbi:MAG: hypothetical protein IJ837_04200 [Clostridia bacterium]|nr:hypothetical protein [Clostridia bacterium]
MKIAGTVVLYNPREEIIENISTYLPFLDKLYVMDNSTQDVPFIKKIIKTPKIKYVSMHGNKGIAKALKDATDLAAEEGYDFLLSMDQDSKFPTKNFNIVEKILNQLDINKVGLIGLNYSASKIRGNNKGEDHLQEYPFIITSGAFLNLKAYQNIDGYNANLFMDLVDYDVSVQLCIKDYKNYIMPNLFIEHNLGEVQTINLGFIKKKRSSHSPIRYYYMYRNFYYLFKNGSKEYKKFIKEIRKDYSFINAIKQSILEKQHIKTWKMIRCGIRDGKNNKLGEYIEK